MEYVIIGYIIKIVLFILGIFFSLMAFGGLLSSIEDFKNSSKNREYIIKFIFTLFPLIFGFSFLYIGITLDI